MEALVSSVLRLQSISKRFGETPALHNVDLEVVKGETIAIIGPSGCGKTTLLRCIGLFEQIDDGAIHFRGEPAIVARSGERPRIHVNVDAYHRDVGMVFQHLHVWPHLTVLQNLALAPGVVGSMRKPEARQRAKELLDRMDIGEKADDYPQALSGGQLQRVALARALMMDPEVLLLDEITSALDPELVGEVLDVIAQLASGGMTMLIVTHEMLFAREVATRVVFLDEGAAIEQGTPEALFCSPQTTRLQTFLRRVTRHRIREESDG